jgi:sulfur-oxidizing protein SoxY
LPVLIENGNSVPMKVSVDSPMTPEDHVRVIHLISERNPVRLMASFYLGPRSGRAQIQSRVRLAGSQRVIALAQMSDGSFWSDTRGTLVTLSACVDESGVL